MTDSALGRRTWRHIKRNDAPLRRQHNPYVSSGEHTNLP